MALFKSDEAIKDAVKQEIAPVMSDMIEGLTALKGAVIALSEKVDGMATDYAKLKASVDLTKNQLEDKAEVKASEKAAAMLAGMGHEPVKDDQGEEAPKSLLEQFASLKGQAQREFYNTHKAELIKLCEN